MSDSRVLSRDGSGREAAGDSCDVMGLDGSCQPGGSRQRQELRTFQNAALGQEGGSLRGDPDAGQGQAAGGCGRRWVRRVESAGRTCEETGKQDAGAAGQEVGRASVPIGLCRVIRSQGQTLEGAHLQTVKGC